MYQSSNSTAYHKSNNETSLSEEDDNKSQDAYSGHTDYEMVNILSIIWFLIDSLMDANSANI